MSEFPIENKASEITELKDKLLQLEKNFSTLDHNFQRLIAYINKPFDKLPEYYPQGPPLK
jgi:predicted nuclease with TOPRIM domain